MSTPENPSAREPHTPAEPGQDSEQQPAPDQEQPPQQDAHQQDARQPWEQPDAQQPWERPDAPQPWQAQHQYGEQRSNGHRPQPGQGQPEQGQPEWGRQPSSPYGQQPSYTRPPTEHADANSPFGAGYGAASPQNPYTQQAAGQPGPGQNGQSQGGQSQNGQSQGGRPGFGDPPPGTQPGTESGQPGPGQQGQPGQPGYSYPPPPPGYGDTYGAPQGTGTVPGMPPYAGWGQRAGAWLIDNLIAAIGIAMTDMSYYGWGHGLRIAGWIVAVAGSIWAIYNAYQAGQTGQSTGKRYTGIRLARYVDGQVVGPAFGLLRLFMNVVFWVICFIPGVLNYLWPLWDKKSQTWSDKIASSVVVRAR